MIQLVVAYYFAKYVSTQVLAGKYLYVVMLFLGSIYFLMAPWKHKYILFSLAIFFPLTFPRYFPLPMKSFVELLAPILCVLSIAESKMRGQTIFSKKASLYFIAIGILVLWSIVHYVHNPVLGQQTFGVTLQSGGIKSYYLILAGTATFLCSFLFFKNNDLNIERWFAIALILCLVIGNVYMLALFKPVPVFRYIMSSFALGVQALIRHENVQYQSIPLRLMAILGTTLLFCAFHKKKWGLGFILVFVNIMAFMVLGGGRSSIPSIFLSVGAYVVLINRKHVIPVISVCLIVAGLYVFLFSNINLDELKFGRAFKTKGGLEEQDAARYYSFLYMRDVFLSNPVFGKGIGYKQIIDKGEFFDMYPAAKKYAVYVEEQIMRGGHGGYLSTASVFGIGGIFWLMVMLFGSIYYSYKLIKSGNVSQSDTKAALFVFLYLICVTIGLTVGGNGYGHIRLWFLAGVVAGLRSKHREKGEIQLSASQ